jgi:hypothetical protein
MTKKPSKKAHQMKTHEAIHRIFGKAGAKSLRELAALDLPISRPRKSLETKGE